jgi:hypothetical protein
MKNIEWSINEYSGDLVITCSNCQTFNIIPKHIVSEYWELVRKRLAQKNNKSY